MLKNLSTQVQKEKDEFLSFLLNNRFFKVWKNWDEDENSSFTTIEIYLTSFCNQKCEYCYLKDNEEIYPKDFNNKEIILKNYRLFLEYLTEKKYKINTIEIFSGDIWHTDFGIEVLKIFYEYITKGLGCKQLLIPSNGFFASDYKTLIPIQNIINDFKQKDVRLQFSISIDGKIVEDSCRPLENQEDRNDEYYENIFSFAKANQYCYHPMISAYGIEKWKENYIWWKNMCEKYSLNLYSDVMFLEVRNNDWTDEKIKKYCELLEFMLEDFYKSEYIKNKKKRMINILLDNWQDEELSIDNYFPFLLPWAGNIMPCTVDKDLTVRMGDLAICPCHRLAQENNIYGYFKIENNKIIGISARNIEMAARILLGNPMLCSLKCEACAYKNLCIKGCLGSQKEASKDPFIPIECVCKLFQKKIYTILKWLDDKDILEKLYQLKPNEKGWQKAKIIIEIWEQIKDEI